jgi:hypothetical protein
MKKLNLNNDLLARLNELKQSMADVMPPAELSKVTGGCGGVCYSTCSAPCTSSCVDSCMGVCQGFPDPGVG